MYHLPAGRLLLLPALLVTLWGWGTVPVWAQADLQGKENPGIMVPPTPDGPPLTLTLPDVVALALRDNRAIKSAYLQRIIQKYDLTVAEDKFSPRLTLAGSALSRRENSASTGLIDMAPIVTMTTPIGTEIAVTASLAYLNGQKGAYSSTGAVTLRVLQPLLRGGGETAGMASVRLARLDEQANVLRLRATVSRTISTVILRYRDFLKAEQQTRIGRAALQRSRDLLAVNRALIDAGRMAEVEIVQTEADVAQQEYAVEDAANQRDASRLALLSELALSPRTNIVAADIPAPEQMRVDTDAALRLALENQPDYLVQRIAIERAKISVFVARNQQEWDLSLVGGTTLGRSRVTADTSRDRGVYGGLQLAIPLGDLSTEQAAVAAGVAQRTAELELEEIRQRVEQTVRDAVRNVHSRWRQLELAGRARDLAEKTIEIEKEKLAVGRSSTFQVLSFENDLRAAEEANASALISYLNALTLLDEALGMTLETWRISLDDR